ncbi:hypothetical protein [Enterococcus sp. AZ072]|uniref:hypothetical protein n=1 Tax=unclassified Enterococcus TaxID=2608891 RepID=UPI003D2B320F
MKKRQYVSKREFVLLVAVVLIFIIPSKAEAATDDMYRLYNPNSGEHFYTKNGAERDMLKKVGWRDEGIGWYAPTAGDPVYRLYNANAGDHHYTLNGNEKDMLVKTGWHYEGVGWYSDTNKTIKLYRAYNPNAKAGSHNYTVNGAEQNMLIRNGWKDEGLAWYGTNRENNTNSAPTPVSKLGNSGILEKTLQAAGAKGDAMRKDPKSIYYYGNPVNGDWNYSWAFISKEVKMSDSSVWYSIEFYPIYVG